MLFRSVEAHKCFQHSRPVFEWNTRTIVVDGDRCRIFADVKLNRDAIAVLQSVVGQHPQYCFTYRGKPIRWEMTNTAWHRATAKAGLTDFRFHDLRHTRASWHRQAGTSCDELKDLGGRKSRVMVDRYAKFATEHLAAAASRVESWAGNREA